MRMTTIDQFGFPQFPVVILPFLFSALDPSAALPLFHTHRHHRISFIRRQRSDGSAGRPVERYRSLLSLSTTVAFGKGSKVVSDARLSFGLFWRLVNGHCRRRTAECAPGIPPCLASTRSTAGHRWGAVKSVIYGFSERRPIVGHLAARPEGRSTAEPPPAWTQFSARVTWTDPGPNDRRRLDTGPERWPVQWKRPMSARESVYRRSTARVRVAAARHADQPALSCRACLVVRPSHQEAAIGIHSVCLSVYLSVTPSSIRTYNSWTEGRASSLMTQNHKSEYISRYSHYPKEHTWRICVSRSRSPGSENSGDNWQTSDTKYSITHEMLTVRFSQFNWWTFSLKFKIGIHAGCAYQV